MSMSTVLTVTVTLTVLLSLFAFSYARTTLILPENDVIHRDTSHSLPESDTKPTIRLPTDKPPSKPGNIADPLVEPEAITSKPLDTDTQPIDSAVDLPESEADAATLSRPMTVVSFRPINRQFRLKRPNPLRLSHHRCRHRSKTTSRNDAMLPRENSDLDPVMFRGGVRQIPARWVTFHHHHRHHYDERPRVAFKHHRVSEKERFKTGRKNEREEKKGRQQREGGFMKRIRKFLITSNT